MGNRKNKRSTVQVREIAKSIKLTRIQANKKTKLSDDVLEADDRSKPKKLLNLKMISTQSLLLVFQREVLMIAVLEVILHLKLKLKWIAI